MGEIDDFLDCDSLSRGTISGEDKVFDGIGHVKRTDLPMPELTARKHYLKHAFNLSLAQYDEMFEQQGGKCLICRGVNKSGNRLSVDHNHATGKIRGLLCNSCNLGLGAFKDSPEILRNAIEYLENR